MSAFRKFDPYTFLADQEGGGAPSAAASEAPETLAALATLAGEHPQNENKGSENEGGTGKSGVTPAKAAKAANPSVVDIRRAAEGLGADRSEPTQAKAAKPAKTETDGAETLVALAGLAASAIGATPAVIAPGQWFEPAATADEPPYDQPCPTRRGLIRRHSGRFEHFCHTCGRWGAFGYDVSAERLGRWFCLQHRPDAR
jgi:hypothetical protein